MRRTCVVAVVWLVVTLILTPALAADDLPELQFEKYELPNGLDVILHEDHTIPMVAVNVWYHTGSKNETPGRTGFAHLFEHMMFQGSEHFNRNFTEGIVKYGGVRNGSTGTDCTNYWENMPSNYLEKTLWLEADRMGYLLPAVTQERLDVQRNVVMNEKRQNRDDQPYGRVEEISQALLYPPNHPYSWTTIGLTTSRSSSAATTHPTTLLCASRVISNRPGPKSGSSSTSVRFRPVHRWSGWRPGFRN